MTIKFSALAAAWVIFVPIFTAAQTQDTTRKDTIPPISKPKTLKAAIVTGQRPLVEHLIDRTVINPEALIANAGASALDVLDNSPGVTVDQNGAITLQGKSGVQVFIDDRPTYLSGEDLANYLRSMPSSTIDRIELMPNPPAKYDAAGGAGVINIRTKRIKEKGFNGNLNLAYGQGVYTRTNNSLNLNYRYGRLNLSASFAYILNNTYNQVHLNRYFDQSITGISPNFFQHSYTRPISDNYNTRLALDFYSTEKTTLGVVFTGLLTTGSRHTTSTSQLTGPQDQPDSTILADNRDNRRFEHGGINLNYRHAYDKKGWEHTIDLDYLTYQTRLDQTFVNDSYYPDGTLYDSTLETGHLPSTIHIFAAKTDYTQPLADGITLSAGLKSSYTRTDNLADYYNIVDQTPFPDYAQTNHFIYSENINAAYVNATRNFRRLSLQTGLRFENTIANGHQLGNPQVPDSSFSRNYNGLFPTLYLQYKLDTSGKQLIEFNYGRRVDRPYYASLNPFLSPLDKFTYNAGNPFLLPSYSDEFQLSYIFKKITATLFYTYIRDKIDDLVQIVNGIYYSRPGNLDNTYMAGMETDINVDPFRWFNFHLYVRLMEQRTLSAFYTGTLDTKGFQYYYRPILTFKPGGGWTVQLTGFYQGKLVSEQFIDLPRYAVNFSLAKKLSPDATLRLNINDIFHTINYSWDIGYLAGTTADYHNVTDTRNIVLAFSYHFGKAIKGSRKHEATGAESEQGRVGN
jgi:Outer membrane protein beta-barrel family/TonB-dependent Receptor Plug Domain